MNIRLDALAGGALLLVAGACSSSEARAPEAAPQRAAGTVYTVKDTTVQATFQAAGVAQPIRQATLSTKLMGTVVEVLVKEGDAVSAGEPLVRIDARDLAAKQAQVAASIAEADAMQREAATQERRIRALYTDSAATKAQLDGVETALARANAAVEAAHATAAELQAVDAYSVVRAPFAGTVTRRFVDPGAFAAPGAPLIAVLDATRLRVTANATPDVVRGLRRGQTIAATIEDQPVDAIVEGIVPATAGNLYTVNALVANHGGSILPGSTATLQLPLGARAAVVVPERAVRREGDLTGVIVRAASGDETRWVRLGPQTGDVIQVNAGLSAGDQVVVPQAGPATVAEKN